MDMIKVFVSYRRDDSRHQSGRLFDHLVEQFGDEHVFRDVDSIPLGLDFRKILTERVAGCDVLLAVIGDEWLSIAGPSGIRRLDEPSDFVRFEIEAALSRSIPVVPVLVGNCPVPKAEELPVSLRDLAYRQSRRVRSDPDFHHDVECLVRGIEDVVTVRPEVAQTPRPHWVWPSVVFGVLMLGLLAAWLAGAFKVKTPNGAVRAENVPKDSGSRGVMPQNPIAAAKLIPPSGPARGVHNDSNGPWTVEGDQLVKRGPGTGFVKFGHDGWRDYDFTIEARKSAAAGSFSVGFRSDDWRGYVLNFAGDEFSLGRHSREATKNYPDVKKKRVNSEIQAIPGTIRPGVWYKLKISMRGPNIHIDLDDHLLFACTDYFSQKGNVSVRGGDDSSVRFCNIKVSAPDGTVLWEGPPDLRKE